MRDSIASPRGIYPPNARRMCFQYGQAELGILLTVADPNVYKTQSGLILRVVHADDGGLKVEMLKEGAWIAARIGMAGLRLSPSTRKLTERQVRALPD
jgi:hypothetical protein